MNLAVNVVATPEACEKFLYYLIQMWFFDREFPPISKFGQGVRELLTNVNSLIPQWNNRKTESKD